jgi:hypothetical protein
VGELELFLSCLNLIHLILFFNLKFYFSIVNSISFLNLKFCFPIVKVTVRPKSGENTMAVRR